MTPQVFDPARPRGYVHSRDKLAERYGLDLTPEEHLRLSRMVAENDLRAVPVSLLRSGRMLVAFHLGNGWVPAVWSPTSGTIVTFREPGILDRYRGMLARIDPETGKGREAVVPGMAEAGLGAGVVRIAPGLLEWKNGELVTTLPLPPPRPARKPAKFHQKTRGLGPDAERLRRDWIACPLDGHPPEDPGEIAAEILANKAEIAALIAERETDRFDGHMRSIRPELKGWYDESTARMAALYARNEHLRSIPGPNFRLPKSVRKSPAIWWAGYASICDRLGCDPTVDPAPILAVLVPILGQTGRRLKDFLSPEELDAFALIQRWVIRDWKGPPPDYFAASPAGQTAEPSPEESDS